MVVCYFWLITVTNLCHSNKFSLSNQQITFYSVLTGRAGMTYAEMDPDVPYHVLKSAILRHYEINPKIQQDEVVSDATLSGG